MCEPITASQAIGIGATALGSGLSIMGRVSAQGAAQANRDAAVRTALDQTIPSINASLGQVYNSNAARVNQERDKAATEAFDVTRQMAEAKGSAVAAAGDAGVGGVSFANILGDFEMREGLNKANSDYNYKTKAQQVADENTTAQTRGQAQINGALNGAVASTPVPSTMSTLAGAAGDAIGAGLKIGDRLGLFDAKTKIDPVTGRTITSKG